MIGVMILGFWLGATIGLGPILGLAVIGYIIWGDRLDALQGRGQSRHRYGAAGLFGNAKTGARHEPELRARPATSPSTSGARPS